MKAKFHLDHVIGSRALSRCAHCVGRFICKMKLVWSVALVYMYVCCMYICCQMRIDDSECPVFFFLVVLVSPLHTTFILWFFFCSWPLRAIANLVYYLSAGIALMLITQRCNPLYCITFAGWHCPKFANENVY